MVSGSSPPDTNFHFTHIFSQFNGYEAASDKSSSNYRYHANGFSTGANYRYGPNVSGYVFGGYSGAVDKTYSPVASRSDYDLPQVGGQLRYAFSRYLAALRCFKWVA